jgi:RND superfamily putative drug exporter
MILVPAVMTLLGRDAWWMPGWLERVVPTLHLEEELADEPSPRGQARQLDKLRRE